jgi:diketogulonate reductase-like aldo/keto reductase
MPVRVVTSLALGLNAQILAVDIPAVTLNNGVEMPMLIFGTGRYSLNNTAAETFTRQALHVGFPGVDAAMVYLNQEAVGRALADFDRSSYFLTSKVGGLDVVGFPAKEYHGTLNACNSDLKKLGVEYVDLMLLHFPPISSLGSRCKVMQEQYRALEDFMKAGKARAIGVSNYCQADIECIMKTATVVPAVNQVQHHVGMGPDPRSLKSYCDAMGITLQSFSPLGGGDTSLITGNFTNDIGKHYNKTGAQVALRWLTQHGIPLNTATSSEKHLREDFGAFEFNFTEDDLQALDAATEPAGEPDAAFPGMPICGPVSNMVSV